MIVTRTIAPGVITISAFVFEMRLAFPIKYFNLLEYRENNEIDNFNIEVDPSWNAADDIALDLLISNHIVGLSPLAIDGYQFDHVIIPVATGSLVFQLARSWNFVADTDWVTEFAFISKINIANNSQRGEIEYRLNGVPILTSSMDQHNSVSTAYGGARELSGFILGTNTIDFYIRKLNGGALITMEELHLSIQTITS